MTGEQLYGLARLGAMARLYVGSPAMRALPLRQLLAMNRVSAAGKFTRVGDRTYLNTFTPFFPSLAYERYIEGVAKTVQGQPLPVMMNFALTADCICDCWHCSFSDRSKTNPLSLGELKAAIAGFQELGTSMMGFTGGEPLLRKDLEEIIGSVGEKSMSLLFSTGYGLDASRVRALKSAGLGIPVVSLDHYRPDVHDQRRGKPGMHATAVKAIELYKAEGMYVAVSFVPDRSLLSQPEELRKTLDFFKSLGVNDMRLTSPILSGQLNSRPEEKLGPEEVKRVHETQRFLSKTRGYPACFAYDVFEGEDYFGCGAGFHFVFVDSAGNVCPCDFCSLSLGNLRTGSLQEIWAEYSSRFRAPTCSCYANTISQQVLDEGAESRPLSEEASRRIISACPAQTHKGKLPRFYRDMGFVWKESSTGSS